MRSGRSCRSKAEREINRKNRQITVEKKREKYKRLIVTFLAIRCFASMQRKTRIQMPD